jgi:3-oxoacyl-[acyl-carrier protein] reductase
VSGTGQLEGRVAIVTGAARGIGEAIAVALACEGAGVAVVDRDAEPAGAVAERICREGGRAIAIAADVTDPVAVEQAVARTVAELGGLHILVNNAGVCSVAPVIEMPLDEWRRLIETDLTSVFIFTKAVLPTLVGQRWGRIINIGSQLALKGSDTMAHYCAAKAGVHGFTRALAHEVAADNVTVNVIAPGPIETDMLWGDPQDWLDRKRREMPLGRFGRVEEIAPTAVLLASDGGSFYTGSTLNLSGGDVM